MKKLLATIIAAALTAVIPAAHASEPSMRVLEKQFRGMPMEARRFVQPLFWLHGNESKDRLNLYIDKMVEGHNGGFCAESRPHDDWLGPRWFSDLGVCLQAAKKNDLKMWIFDEKWWPSQTLDGRVPPEYAAKQLEATAIPLDGPSQFSQDGFGDKNLVAVIAGKVVDAAIDPESLIKLTPDNGKITWDAPAGKWQLMKFTWGLAPHAAQGGNVIVDGASKDCVDWFLRTVYQPHFDRFKDDFGKTIVGFFYDEPETQGDWGTELTNIFAERGVDEKKALTAWKFNLAGDDQVAAKYAYVDALTEAWGRTMYGGMTRWCESRGVASIGHFIEHDGWYLNRGLGATNLFDMQKYCAMGGMDLVCRQLYPGNRDKGIYQVPKLTSSVSHAYNKPQQLAMCEIYGAYGQEITYPQMKWLLDWHQVSGVNFMIPHSFNPKAPNDTDCPPYFYADDAEPRWPLYRIWADYSNRLSLMLTGGRHVCPIAFLFCGNSAHVGKAVTPEDMTTTIQDALYDCDWLPYEVFEGHAAISDKTLSLYDENYQALIVPPVEAIPYAALVKAKEFFDKGGVVIGYDFLPSKSATLGQSSGLIASIRDSIWNGSEPGLNVCKTNPYGGRSYFLPASVTPEELQQVLTDAGIRPALTVLEGKTDHWLHVLHRVKSGRDVFFVCNQNHEGEARRFRLRVMAEGAPERWDAMRNDITAIAYERVSAYEVEFDLTLQPSESALIVFQKRSGGGERNSPPRKKKSDAKPMLNEAVASIPVVRYRESGRRSRLDLSACPWVWYPEGDPRQSAPPGTRWFKKEIVLPQREVKSARFLISADNELTLYVNDKQAGSTGGTDAWRVPKELDIAGFLNAGNNLLTVEARNGGDRPNPAGLIGRLLVEFAEGEPLTESIDGSWQASNDAKAWQSARVIGKIGDSPWDGMVGALTEANPFKGRCAVPKEFSSVYLEMDDVTEGASVKVNGKFAGGMIGAPYRLNVTSLIKPGGNTFEIEPYAPKAVRLLVY